jgi:carbamoyltransferase
MGDEGLAYGAACVGAMERDPQGARQMAATPLAHVFLGPDCEPTQIERALSDCGLSARSTRDIAGEAARLLADGHVVARCTGRMEYGPRALGNRSILYRPDDVSVNDWLNQRLDRTEFMPFAPATPLEWVDEMYEDARAVEHAAQFMTVTRDCTPWARRHCPGVVHCDGTARPQYVRAAVSPGFHAILHEFRRLTNLPGVINTSFNIHEEPIVCTPQDAVRAFLAGGLDYLILGDAIVRHPALEAKASSGSPQRGVRA